MNVKQATWFGRGIFLMVLLAAIGTLAAGRASAAATCDLVAASNGSDAAPGTVARPLATVQKLVNTLHAGQTGCLRTGTYVDASDGEVNIDTPNVTLTSYPGERATVRTRLWIEQTSDDTTISNLDLDGRNARGLPSPTINADRVVILQNDITNYHTTICISVGSGSTWGRAHDTLIKGNRIHDCGELPATNYSHGIYVNSADNTVIKDNLIYDNADRGIQLYPDAQGSLITGNVIDGNGEGVIFGGGSTTASSNNVVEKNIITNSKLRDNVESSWGGSVGTGNVVRNNCVGGGAYDEGDGGILQGSIGKLGFTAQGNLRGVPKFADRAAKDFTIDPATACGQLLGLTTTPPPDTTTTTPPPDTTTTTPPPEVTLDTKRKKVKVAKPLRVRGTAPGARRVQIQIHRDGGWHGIGLSDADSDGSYSTRVAIRRSGRGRIKAVAVGLQDSAPVEVKVKRKHRRR